MDKLLSGYPQPTWSQAVLDRIAALEADQHSVDGITITLDKDKIASVPVFTKPTTSDNGKAGLVPAPAVSQIPQNVILTAAQFQEVDMAFMHPSAVSAELNKTQLDLGTVSGEGVNIDTLLQAGIFAATQFGGTLPQNVYGGVLFNLMSYAEVSDLYYGQQILCTYGNNIYYRVHNGGIAPGGTISWREWYTLGSPRPNNNAAPGQWIPLSQAGETIQLPDGYTWAYYFVCGGATHSNMAAVVGVAAGGTVVPTQSGVTFIHGLAWRVA